MILAKFSCENKNKNTKNKTMPPQKKLFTNHRCDVCHKEFASKDLLQKHKMIHTDEYRFSCSQCDFRCKMKNYLRRHVKAVHRNQRDYECDECGKRFLFPSKLAAHKLVHTGEKPYKCTECDKAFNSTYSLNTHKFIHTGEKPFQCPHCPYACRDGSTLRKHAARHEDAVRLFRCVTCGLRLKSKASLKSHVAEKHLNLDLRRYFCDTCKKGFKAKNTLSVHVRTVHMRMKQAKCPVCGVIVANYSNMAQHMVSHSERRPYACRCGTRFKCKSDLKKHAIIHEPEQHVKCEICDRSFARKHRLVKHVLRMHARKPEDALFECVHCGEKFINAFRLKKHKRREHFGRKPPRRKYECDLCGFVTTLKSCIIMHIKYGHAENKYTKHCNECRQKFRREYSYVMHMATEHGVVVEKAKARLFENEKAGDKCEEDDKKENVVVKEELDLDEVRAPIDLFEVEKEEVLEDHLPKEIQETIQNALQNESYGEDSKYEISIQKEDCMVDEKGKFGSLVASDKNTSSIQNVRNTDLSLATSIQCDKSELPIEFSKTDCMVMLPDYRPDMELDYIQKNVNSIQNNNKNMPHEENEVLNEEIDKTNIRGADSIQEQDYHTNKESNTQPSTLQGTNASKQMETDNTSSIQTDQDHTNSIQKTQTIDLTEENDETDTKIINIDENNYLEVIKQLIVENKNELRKISDEVFDQFFIDRVEISKKDIMRKKRRDVKKSRSYLNVELKEELQKEIKSKVVQARRKQIAEALEKTRRVYNRRLNRALGIVNPKEKIKVKYFNKNQVQLVELEKLQDSELNEEKSDESVEKSSSFSSKPSRRSSRLSSRSSTASKRSSANESLLSEREKSVSYSLKGRKRSKDSTEESAEKLQSTDGNSSSKNGENIDKSVDKTTENSEGTPQLEEYEETREEIEENGKIKNNSKCKLKLNTHQCYVCFKLYKTKDELLEHCKQHFDVTTDTCLKKCPICGLVTSLSVGSHMKKKHGVSVTVPYGTIHKQNENERISKYYYKMSESERTEFEKIEIIPSVKCLNHIASRKLDKMNKEIKNKTVSKTKLVKKGKEWIVESEKVDFDKTFLLPKFNLKDIDIDEKKIKVNEDFKIVFNYIENLKKIYIIAKKKGLKMMFPCKKCDKVCQTLAALKLHVRQHDPNKKPFKAKVWKHKLKDMTINKTIKISKDSRKINNNNNKSISNKRKTAKKTVKEESFENILEMNLKERLKRIKKLKKINYLEDSLDISLKERLKKYKRLNKTVNNKTNNGNSVDIDTVANGSITKTGNTGENSSKGLYKKPKDLENRVRNPRPVKNKHKCDPQLIEFYNQNVKGGDIEFWQFLKIFNRITKENINEFSDLKKRTDFGLDIDVNNGETAAVGEKINKSNNTEAAVDSCAIINNQNHNNSLVSVSKSHNNNKVNEKASERKHESSDIDGIDEEAIKDDDNLFHNNKSINNVINNVNFVKNVEPTTSAIDKSVVLDNSIGNISRKVSTKTVTSNRRVSKNFNLKKCNIGPVVKNRVWKLSRDEVKRREAKKQLLREKFASEVNT